MSWDQKLTQLFFSFFPFFFKSRYVCAAGRGCGRLSPLLTWLLPEGSMAPHTPCP